MVGHVGVRMGRYSVAEDVVIQHGGPKKENTHLLSSPGFQSFHTDQFVYSLHRASHRCNELLFPHVSSMAPVVRGRYKGYQGSTWMTSPIKNNVFIELNRLLLPQSLALSWLLSPPRTLLLERATWTSPHALVKSTQMALSPLGLP